MNFDIADFLPYLLNRAAERASDGFRKYYKTEYGMLRTEWRVLFHLGRYGQMTANDICRKGNLHKTKVSRAVSALEQKRFVIREKMETDRRYEMLKLTPAGERTFLNLLEKAEAFQAELLGNLPPRKAQLLFETLKELSDSKSDRGRSEV